MIVSIEPCALTVMKAIAGSSCGFMTESLMATYKVIVHPIINYAAPVWFTQVSSYHLDKLEVIQNRALRITTCCHQKASHIRAETGVLPRLHTMNCAHNSSMKELSTSPPPPFVPSSPQGNTPGPVPLNPQRPAS